MYRRIRTLFIVLVILFVVGCCALVGAYYKGRNDSDIKCSLAESKTVIQLVEQKEKIDTEIAKKTVLEKRKELKKYVIQ